MSQHEWFSRTTRMLSVAVDSIVGSCLRVRSDALSLVLRSGRTDALDLEGVPDDAEI